MNTTKTFTRVLLITAAVTVAALGIAALIGLASGGFRGAHLGRGGTVVDERKTLPVAGIDQVSIEGVSEDVRVVEGTGDSLEVWLHGSVGMNASARVPRLVDELSGSALSVRVDRDRNVGLGFFWSSLTLEVSVPRGYARKLAVKTVSGDVRVADHRYAGLALVTTSGDAQVGTVNAPDFSMRTTSGRLRADSVTAQRVDLSSVSGDISVSSLTGDTTLRSTSGTVTVAFASVPSQVQAGSTSGDVILRLPADARFVLDAHSTSGDISCRFPITITQGSTGGGRHALAGTVGANATGGTGASGAQVAVTTVSGDIRIEK